MPRPLHISWPATLSALVVVGLLAGPASAQIVDASDDVAKRPNILFMMADDHTAQAFQSYGSRLSEIAPTPNINRLAQQGVRLTNAFATNSICVPSRASILTGQYSHENGVYTLSDTLDPDHPNVAKELQEAGYRTAVIGKWHLGSTPSGFDHYEVLRGPFGQGRYFDPTLQNSRTGEGAQHQGYSADVIADRSLRWLREQSDRTSPFMLMTSVHDKKMI